MAITFQAQEGSSLLEVTVSGKLTHGDYDVFQPKVEEMVRQHGKIRVFFDMADFHGWETGAVWDDTKVAAKYFSDISRIAMVGDKTWQKGMSNFCRPFTKAEIHYFERSDIVRAYAWLESPGREVLGWTPVAAAHTHL